MEKRMIASRSRPHPFIRFYPLPRVSVASTTLISSSVSAYSSYTSATICQSVISIRRWSAAFSCGILWFHRKALCVVNVPAEGDEEGVDELVADRGFAERGVAILVVVALEELHELADFSRDGHRRLTVEWLT
jgi:hypothetical protein